MRSDDIVKFNKFSTQSPCFLLTFVVSLRTVDLRILRSDSLLRTAHFIFIGFEKPSADGAHTHVLCSLVWGSTACFVLPYFCVDAVVVCRTLWSHTRTDAEMMTTY